MVRREGYTIKIYFSLLDAEIASTTLGLLLRIG
jgi:hypothetical protein